MTYSLSDLANFIRRVFALNLPQAVWVLAELAQANTSREHVWLTLVEKDPDGDEVTAQLEGVVWARQVQALRRTYGVKVVRDLFRQGMSVRLKVSTSFHPRYGLRLVVEDIDPAHTIGALERRRQLTLQRLDAANLLERNSRLALALAPQRLAVISSETAAGLADFRRQLLTNPYGYSFSTTLFSAAMQGVETSTEIRARLRQVARRADKYDAVIIIRGGGGRMDLSAFDDEALAMAVAQFPLPVIVGIGHETDETVLDKVAHHSLKTPTATAVFLIERLLRLEGRVLQLGREIQRAVGGTLAQEIPRLARYRELSRQIGGAALRAERHQLNRIEKELALLPQRALSAGHRRLDHLEDLLQALRPETTLARGYALVSQEGNLITDPAEIVPGKVEVRLKAGRTTLTK